MAGILPVLPVLRRGVGPLADEAAAPVVLAVLSCAGLSDSRLGTRTSQGRSMGVVGSLDMSDGSLMTLRFGFCFSCLPATDISIGDPHSEQNFAP